MYGLKAGTNIIAHVVDVIGAEGKHHSLVLPFFVDGTNGSSLHAEDITFQKCITHFLLGVISPLLNR